MGVYYEPMEENTHSWIESFLGIRGNDIFCEVDKTYILDKFNLTGLGIETGVLKRAYHILSTSRLTYNSRQSFRF